MRGVVTVFAAVVVFLFLLLCLVFPSLVGLSFVDCAVFCFLVDRFFWLVAVLAYVSFGRCLIVRGLVCWFLCLSLLVVFFYVAVCVVVLFGFLAVWRLLLFVCVVLWVFCSRPVWPAMFAAWCIFAVVEDMCRVSICLSRLRWSSVAVIVYLRIVLDYTDIVLWFWLVSSVQGVAELCGLAFSAVW